MSGVHVGDFIRFNVFSEAPWTVAGLFLEKIIYLIYLYYSYFLILYLFVNEISVSYAYNNFIENTSVKHGNVSSPKKSEHHVDLGFYTPHW